MQRGLHPSLQHLGTKLTGGIAIDPAAKDELHPIGPSQIQVLPDDLLKEFTPPNGTVKHLSAADFHLLDGQTVRIACLPVCCRQRPG
jgi:hypothetical protein